MNPAIGARLSKATNRCHVAAAGVRCNRVASHTCTDPHEEHLLLGSQVSGHWPETRSAPRRHRELLDDEFRILGPNHPDTLETRQELAALRGKSGDVAGAIADFRQLLKDQQRVLRPGHPQLQATRAHLAELSTQ